MCLRVLGYANEVEAKGTWPTNYIAKAQDLKLTKNVDFKSYNDGATRGNIALLIWNMLRTKMWSVVGESEGDGLMSEANDPMLNVKFPDYRYEEEAEFNGFTIKDGKVMVALVDETVALEYAGNDFYEFVDGTKVEVLINVEDETLLTMVPVSNSKLFEGDEEDFADEKLTGMTDAAYDYAYARFEKKEIKAYTTLSGDNTYVEEFEVKKDKVYVNGSKDGDLDTWADRVILRDGERVEIEDLEAGDVLTTVTVARSGEGVETFYVIGSAEAEGKLTKYVEANNEIVVGGETYKVDGKTEYVIDPEDEDEDAESFVDASSNFSKMKNEEVRIVLDAILGKVARIEFDGKIDDNNNSDWEIKLFAIASKIKRNMDDDTYYIELENEDGSDEYTFEENSVAESTAHTAWVGGQASATIGDYVAVRLNEDGNIEGIENIVVDGTINSSYDGDVLPYNADDDNFGFSIETKVSYDKDELGLVSEDDNQYYVEIDDKTVLVKVNCDDNDTENDTSDDKYSIEFLDADEIKDMKKQAKVVVITDSANNSDAAKYVVIFEDIADTSDNKAGVVDEDSYAQNKLGGYEISVDGDEMIVADQTDLTGYQVLVYTTETNDDDEVELTYVSGLRNADLSSTASLDYVEEVSTGRKFTVRGSTEKNLDRESVRVSYEDYTIVLVEVSLDEISESGAAYSYVADSAEIVDYEDLTIKKYDRLSDDTAKDVLFVIRGMEKISE